MHLILTGATGLVGSATLDAMIKAKDITKISVLTRRPIKMIEGLNDPRVNVITHKDFGAYNSEVLNKLKGANGCVWALGISQTQVGPAEYVKITKDYALEAAKVFADLPPDNEPFRFIYVSGEGTTQNPGRFTPIFSRVKGETEVALSEMRSRNPRLYAESVRPGFVDPATHDAIKPFIPGVSRLTAAGRVVLGPPLRAFVPGQVSPTETLGKFLFEMAMGKYDASLSGKGIIKLGDLSVVENIGFRRLAGLS